MRLFCIDYVKYIMKQQTHQTRLDMKLRFTETDQHVVNTRGFKLRDVNSLYLLHSKLINKLIYVHFSGSNKTYIFRTMKEK